MKIKIDGEVYTVKDINHKGYLAMVTLEENDHEYYLAENSEVAGEAARKYWEDIINDSPAQFAAIVGEKVLIAWALGQSAGPGSEATNSLNDWLDLTASYPAEHWAGYDGAECEAEAVDEPDPDNRDLVSELGFPPTVAYRHN